ncbi:superinfection exclusion B family protein [Ferrimonas balearica]|uniref:superinfection exclusion B family protein n=1 Tax=Ferrimonas balearica TaxID=44012 RepID=UPI001C99DC90|nr:superinfection exclusion B family protein [Ferrimonas balearica]MBY5993621.1 superinfection exclusion B family protein [Ferrimonas balearica]
MAQLLDLLRQCRFGPLMTRLALWALVASLALLFLPLSALQSLFLKEWVAQNGFLLGLVTVLSASYLLAGALRIWLGNLHHRQQAQQRRQSIEAKLSVLDGVERAVLREFFLQGKSVIPMPLNHPAVEELKGCGVLVQLGAPEHYAIEGPVGQMKIAAEARAKLSRQALRLPEGNLSEQQRAALLAARPEFANSLGRGRRHAA